NVLESSQAQAELSADRLEISQARIEARLQEVLASQQQVQTLLSSENLDPFNTEGRMTWLELGKVFHREGFEPSMIWDNRDLLLNFMKEQMTIKTTRSESPKSDTASYQTAPEESPLENFFPVGEKYSGFDCMLPTGSEETLPSLGNYPAYRQYSCASGPTEPRLIRGSNLILPGHVPQTSRAYSQSDSSDASSTWQMTGDIGLQFLILGMIDTDTDTGMDDTARSLTLIRTPMKEQAETILME
ncbi:MAG: hypothetical protein Q9164_007268, partial [Protoblastenia rupestris]